MNEDVGSSKRVFQNMFSVVLRWRVKKRLEGDGKTSVVSDLKKNALSRQKLQRSGMQVLHA